MFRIVFQNTYALKGLVASVLYMDPEIIQDVIIKNTVKPGAAITDKEYRMDILATMNDDTTLNLEMQLRNLGNWKYRSLAYLCREFDSLDHGDDYENAQTVYQIGFLGYTLFDDHPEFCANYQLRNKKDNYLYTGRFNLIVVELNHEELATDEDKVYGIDKWVKLFKSTTWEELKMIAQDNKYMESTVESMYRSSEDKILMKIARERDEFLRSQAYKDRKLAELTAENERKNAELAKNAAALAQKDDTIAKLQEKLKHYEENK